MAMEAALLSEPWRQKFWSELRAVCLLLRSAFASQLRDVLWQIQIFLTNMQFQSLFETEPNWLNEDSGEARDGGRGSWRSILFELA